MPWTTGTTVAGLRSAVATVTTGAAGASAVAGATDAAGTTATQNAAGATVAADATVRVRAGLGGITLAADATVAASGRGSASDAVRAGARAATPVDASAGQVHDDR